MTTTNRTVNLADEKSESTEFKPIPQGTYEFEVGEAQVKTPSQKEPTRKDGSIKTPYVQVSVKAFGPGLPETGRAVFPSPMIHLGLNPGSDGKLNYKRENGLLAFFESLGASKPEIEVSEFTTLIDGEEKTADVLSPQQVAEAINALRGSRGKCYLKVKTEVYNGKTNTKNELARFIAPSPSQES